MLFQLAMNSSLAGGNEDALRIFQLGGCSKKAIFNENQGRQRMRLRLSLLNVMRNMRLFTSLTVTQLILNWLDAGNPAWIDGTAPVSHFCT